MAPPLSSTCQKIANELDGLKKDKQQLQTELSTASPGAKPVLIKELNALNNQIDARKEALDDCVKQHPPMPPLINPCLPLKEELRKLERELDEEIREALAPFQEELKGAAPGQKPAIVRQINKTRSELNKNSPTRKKIDAKRTEYFGCLSDHGLLFPLDSNFLGTATLLITIGGKKMGPFTQSVGIGLHFNEGAHQEITVTSFPSITVTYGTPVGEMKTTVSKISGEGTFASATQTITMQLSLLFDHSSILAGDSTLDITLNTVSPLNDKGHIKVSGVSKFKGGYLDGETCSMTVEGTISPRP